jgi:hypothetical protein
MKIYVASSWKNEMQSVVVKALRDADHEVYDFKNDGGAFDWKQIDVDFEKWTAKQTIEAYKHPLAVEGINADYGAMLNCDALIAVQPYGCDASLELGWAIGNSRPTCVLMSDAQKPGLMTLLATHLCTNLDGVVTWANILSKILKQQRGQW